MYFRLFIAICCDDFPEYLRTYPGDQQTQGAYVFAKFITDDGIILTVLHSERIQDELGLSKKVRNDVKTLFQERSREKSDSIAKVKKTLGFDFADDNISDEILKRVAATYSSVNKSFDQRAWNQLSSDNKQRLVELVIWEKIWTDGLLAFILHKKISDTLKLSVEQKKALLDKGRRLSTKLRNTQQQMPLIARRAVVSKLSRKRKTEIEALLGRDSIKGLKFGSVEAMSQQLLKGLTDSEIKKLDLFYPKSWALRRHQHRSGNIDIRYGFSRYYLLGAKPVQIGLELTDKQTRAVTLVLHDTSKWLSSEAVRIKTQNPSDYDEIYDEYRKEFESKIEEILLRHQTKEFDIYFFNGEVIKFGLTSSLCDEDISYLARKITLSTDEKHAVLKSQKTAIREMIAAREKVQDEFIARLLDELSQDQRVKIREIIGERPKSAVLPDLETMAAQVAGTVEKYEKSPIREND